MIDAPVEDAHPDKVVRLTYGNDRSGRLDDFRSKAPHERPRYLTFQTDSGGWNNILMHFEIMVVLAWLTGRTMVLPPQKPFYLLGDEPRSLLDFFDRAALDRYLDVFTPEEFQAQEGLDNELTDHEAFHQFMAERGYAPGWSGVNDTLAHPPNALTTRFELIPRLLGRRPVGIVNEADTCDILYFPTTREYRMFGVAEVFFLFGDPRDERRARTLIRDAIRYRPEIIELAERALQSPALAGKDFGAMHIRRGDFQYEEVWINADRILAHTQNLFHPGQTIYIATDEQDRDFLRALRERYDIVTLADLNSDVVAAIPYHWLGIVETLVCAGAPDRFVGTRFSTFSARISILRGHMSVTPDSDLAGVDTALYYTQPPTRYPSEAALKPYPRPTTKHTDPLGETGLPWWESRWQTPVWGRAHKAVWAETDIDH